MCYVCETLTSLLKYITKFCHCYNHHYYLAFVALLTPCWGNGTAGGPNVPNYPNHGPQEILNPILESTYEFMESLYAEIVQKFPDNFVHLGMDEVYYACWLVRRVLVHLLMIY